MDILGTNMNRRENIQPSLRWALAYCLVMLCSAFAAPSATITNPYSLWIDGNNVHIQNVSDRVLRIQLTIEGKILSLGSRARANSFLGSINNTRLTFPRRTYQCRLTTGY